MKLSVIVPCYNEEDNIPIISERFNDVIGRRNIEVILVNNGSTDNSAKVIDELLSKYKFIKTVSVPVNQGYGYGIIQGLKAADGDYIGWTHADMQTDPADIIKACKIISRRRDEKIYVKGKRIGRPCFDVIFTTGMSIFESIYFKMPLFDINAQPNIFPKEFFGLWDKPPFDFSLDLYALYMAVKHGVRVIRFDVKFPGRRYGVSKWNNGELKSKIKFIKRTLQFSIELKHRL